MLRRLIEGVVVDEDRPKDAALRLKIVRGASARRGAEESGSDMALVRGGTTIGPHRAPRATRRSFQTR